MASYRLAKLCRLRENGGAWPLWSVLSIGGEWPRCRGDCPPWMFGGFRSSAWAAWAPCPGCGGWACGPGWGRAAIDRAHVMVGRVEANRRSILRLVHPFDDQVGHHGHELGMGSHRGRSHHVYAVRITLVAGFLVQVKHHLHVVRQEPHGVDDQVLEAVVMQRIDVLKDIRAQPRIFRPTATALEHQFPAFSWNLQLGGD